MIKAHLLTTGTDGHSHVQSGAVADSWLADATGLRFQETAANTFLDWHTAPTNQYVICLTGTLLFTTFTGETFTLKPGEVLVAMDTTGTGHQWQMLGNEPWRRAYVLFDAGKPVNFIPDDGLGML